jgi:hypothetical protein
MQVLPGFCSLLICVVALAFRPGFAYPSLRPGQEARHIVHRASHEVKDQHSEQVLLAHTMERLQAHPMVDVQRGSAVFI